MAQAAGLEDVLHAEGNAVEQAIGERGLRLHFHPGAHLRFVRRDAAQADAPAGRGRLLAGFGLAEIPAALHRPLFVEEAGLHDLTGEAGVGRHGDVHDGVVRQFGRLAGVGKVVGFAEGEAAVQHDVLLRVERIGKDQDRRVRGGGVACAAEHDAVGGPLHRQAVGDPRQNAIAARVAPEDQVAVGDVGVRDVLIVAHLRVAAELPAPFGDGALLFGGDPRATFAASGVPVGETKTKLSRKASSMGPCRPWRLCRPGRSAASRRLPTARPILRKCAVQERSLPGTGRGQLLTVDRHQRRRATSSGQAPGPIASVNAVTLLGRDVDRAESPAISAFTRARSQCLSERVHGHPVRTGCSAA